MDNIFLEEISNSYLIDRNIKDKTRVFNYLINTRNYIRETNLEIYEEIQYKMSKLNQQKLFYALLDDVIQEDMLFSIGVASILAVIIHKLFNGFDKTLAKLFSKLHQINNGIREDLKNSTINQFSKEHAERYQIVEKILDSNLSNCTKICGVNDIRSINKENITGYMKVLFNTNENYNFVTPRHDKEANCLVSCYLDYTTSTIAELNLLYSQCLHKTGEINNRVENTLTKSIAPVGTKCEQLRKDLNDLKKEFDDFLKYLYKHAPRLYSTWIDILNTKINNSLSNKTITNYAPLYSSSQTSTNRQNLGV